MSRTRKLMAMLGLLFASSSVLVGCSDDDVSTMGAVPVNSVLATGTSVDVVWSIVPNDNCKGYEVAILQGSRDGSVLATKTLDNRTCSATFTGLTPNTKYVIRTQAIPGGSFSDADIFYREFYTAPNVNISYTGGSTYEVSGYDSNGDPTTTTYCTANFSWPAIAETNCGGYFVAIYDCTPSDWTTATKAVASVTISKDTEGNIATTATFDGLTPGHTYTARAYARPNSMCDYSAGDNTLIQFTTVAAN